MAFSQHLGIDDLTPFQVNSRREILTLLHALRDRTQLVSMHADGGADTVVTSVLEIDEENNLVVIDRAPSNIINERMLESENIAFETVLDSIRIMFFTLRLSECMFEDRPALCMELPASV